MTGFKTIDDLDVGGKRVLVRADLNVPMKDGAVTDATRIVRTLPTLAELADKGGRVIVMSHLGRPKGRVVDSLSLRPVAAALGAAMDGRAVAFAADCVGPHAFAAAAAMADGDIVMVENLRFHAGEEGNDPAFAKELAALGDLYVNDAFSCAHRAHASTEAIARLLPAAAGRLMQAELEALASALDEPRHPVAAVVGGAKISTKMDALGHLVDKTDLLIIGGAMANTFLLARGVNVGRSLCEPDMTDSARAIMAAASRAGCDIALPVDAVVAREFAEGAESETVPVDAIPPDAMILDLGPASVGDLVRRLEGCRTLVWNGPLGAFEVSPFDAGTTALARAVARLTKEGRLISVAGGGDTVAALAKAGVGDGFTYVSTAGGAFLEWLEGKVLPGVAALQVAD
ncbi:MAG: phosphoglycerate kinase [Proteobacteria bacterium]|nr:phosphoglycerate kinase [Pseudomonadota bacterium]